MSQPPRESSLPVPPPVAFGTSGVRGLVADLTDEVCAAYAAAFVEVMAPRWRFGAVAVGMDLRPSSPRIAAACASAIRASGREVDFVGALPTPALALHAMSRGVPAVMVTGSHIPFDRNGLKFYRPDGEIDKADEAAILGALRLPRVVADSACHLPAPSDEARFAYLARCRAAFAPGCLAGMRVGVYEHSSVARDLLRELLASLGAEVVALGRTDAFVPIDTEAVSAEDVERARAWVSEHRLDALVSTDGDADRPMIADDTGAWLRGDVVGVLTARSLGIERVAVPVSCNSMIERCGSFARVLRTRIGSPYVIEGMAALREDGASVAGFEANGGFLLATPVSHGAAHLAALPTRDSLLPIVAVLVAARAAEGRRLSRLVAALPSRFTASDRLQGIGADISRPLLARWSAAPGAMLGELGLEGAEASAVDLTDGVRLTLADGRIVHFRASGNAPELRCYAEASTPDAAAALVAESLARVPVRPGETR